MLSASERSFLDRQRVARLATADASGVPHVVPVCFAIDGQTLYTTIDEKPKRPGAELKRLRNIRENPSVALVVDRYDEDWARLGWVMLHGHADVLEAGPEHVVAQTALKARYSQYARMTLAGLPVIAVRVGRVTSWGELG